jgi:flagella basal body P-ring formation protein FlgA
VSQRIDAVRRLIKEAACLSLCAQLGAACAATQQGEVPLLRVALKTQVEVAGGQVALGDIAALSSPNLSLLRRAMALPLGYAPRVGETATLEGDQLKRLVRQRTGLDPEQIGWEGGQTVVLSTRTKEISGDEIVSLAQAALLRHLSSLVPRNGNSPPRIELEAASVPSGVLIPVASGELRVRPLDHTPMAKRVLVWVDVYGEGLRVRTVPVRFEVGIYSLAPIAASDMVAGTQVESEQLTMREINIAGLRLTEPAPGLESVGLEAKQVRGNVRAGEVLTADRLQDKPAVSRGDWVSIVSRSGGLALESRVEVLQDGRPGQTVRARALNANGPLLARVIGPGHLELQP